MDPGMLSHVLTLRRPAREKRLAQRWPSYALTPSSNSAEPDSALVAAMVNGDRRALQALYARYALTLVTFAERLVGNRAEAEDLLQDVFFEAWRKADTYDAERGGVQNWLLLRLRSRALDRLKSAHHRRTAPALPRTPSEPLTDDDPSSRYFALLARRAFLSLPKGRRNLLGLLHVLELSHAEAALSLGCALGTVKSRSSRFLDELRGCNVAARR